MRTAPFLALLIFTTGCGDQRVRVADEDINRCADQTAKKVLEKLQDKMVDDLAYRIHQRIRDLERVEANRQDRKSVRNESPDLRGSSPNPSPSPASVTAVPLPPTSFSDQGSIATIASSTLPPTSTSTPDPAQTPASAAPPPTSTRASERVPNRADPEIVRIANRVWRKSEIEELARNRNLSLDQNSGPSFLDELVGFELAAIKVRSSNIPKHPEFERRLKNALAEFAAHALYRERMATLSLPTESELRRRYEKSIGLYTEREFADVEEFYSRSSDDLEKLKGLLKPGTEFANLKDSGKVPPGIYATSKTTVRAGQYPVEMFRSLRALKPGQFAESTRMESGYLAVRLISYHPESTIPFEKVKGSLKGQVEQDRLQQALKEVDSLARKFIEVKLHKDRLSSLDSLAVLAEIGDLKVLRQDLLRELAVLPEQYRRRFEGNQGMAELLDRVVQKALFAQYAFQHSPDFKTRYKDALVQLQTQEEVKFFLEVSIGEKSQISSEEIRAYYEKNSSRYKGDELHLRNISFQAAGGQKQAAAMAKVKQAMDRLKGGEPFEKVAKALSEDQETKDRGGDMGWVSPDQLTQAMRAEIARLTPGSLSPAPVLTPQGVHLVQLLERRSVKPLSVVQVEIESILKAERQRRVFDEMLKEWKREIPVEIHAERMDWPREKLGDQKAAEETAADRKARIESKPTATRKGRGSSSSRTVSNSQSMAGTITSTLTPRSR